MCQHEDYPCCNCGDENRDELDGTNYDEAMMDSMCGDSDYDEDYDDCDDSDFMSDTEADADVLRSAGMGTDEDYDHFGYDRYDVDTPMGEDYGGE